MKKIIGTLTAVAFAVGATASFAACDAGERVVKLSHVTGGTTHPKVVAANNLAERVNKELNGKMCVEVYPNSTLFGDSKELEALLLGDVQLHRHSQNLVRTPRSTACSISRLSLRTWTRRWHSQRLRQAKSC